MHHISISKAILAVIYLFKVEMQTPNKVGNLFKVNKKNPERRRFCSLLTLNKFHTLFWCFHCRLGTSKCRPGLSIIYLVSFSYLPTAFWRLVRRLQTAISYTKYLKKNYLVFLNCFCQIINLMRYSSQWKCSILKIGIFPRKHWKKTFFQQ